MQTIRDILACARIGWRIARDEFATIRHLRRGGNPDMVPF